jgi:hypothetical protein
MIMFASDVHEDSISYSLIREEKEKNYPEA